MKRPVGETVRHRVSFSSLILKKIIKQLTKPFPSTFFFGENDRFFLQNRQFLSPFFDVCFRCGFFSFFVVKEINELVKIHLSYNFNSPSDHRKLIRPICEALLVTSDSTVTEHFT
jgi:hypothetical protein